MNEYIISVIIPVYNAEKYLNKCLDSIVNQTLHGLEVVCVNDGSTDNSFEILKEYSLRYSNIKVINQSNKGIIEARIKGYENTTGQYIGWVDNDDFIERYMYQKLYNIAIQNDADIAICNYSFYPEKISIKKKWYKEYKGKHDVDFISNNGLLWNKIIKKSLLEEIDFVNLLRNLGEGSYTIALLNTHRIVNIDEELYHYRVGHGSMSGSYFGKIDYYSKNRERENAKFDLIKQMNIDNELKIFFEYYALRSSLILSVVAMVNDDRELFNATIEELKRNNFFGLKYRRFMHKDFGKVKTFYFKYCFVNFYMVSRIVFNFVFK